MRTLARPQDEHVNWVKSIPFFICHLLPLAALYTGFGWTELVVCAALYYLRMFFITAGYHRYFAHRSYKLGRVMQFLMAFGGSTSAQKGVLWWAAHHRHHHRFSDKPQDLHSPMKGFWWSHVGWFLCDKYEDTRFDLIKDLTRYPELTWLNRYWLIAPVSLAATLLALGGWSYLWLGFFLSTVLLWHGTFLVNSVAHVFGRRRYVTSDTSRNSLLIALLTCGEGWHNNHHHLQSTVRQGFFWWELDPSYYVLRALAWLGLASELRQPSPRMLQRNRVADGHFDIGMFDAYWAKAMCTFAEAQQSASDYYEQKKKVLAEAQRQAAEYYEAKRRSLEEYTAVVLADAQKQASEFYDAKRKVLEEMVESTRTPAKVDAQA